VSGDDCYLQPRDTHDVCRCSRLETRSTVSRIVSAMVDDRYSRRTALKYEEGELARSIPDTVL
jgi:hypothetical protein